MPRVCVCVCCISSMLFVQVLGLYRGMSSPIAAVGVINSMVFGVYGHFLRLQHSVMLWVGGWGL